MGLVTTLSATIIGMCLVYLATCGLASAINEVILAWTALRAKHLKKLILSLDADEGMMQKIYEHPVISSITGARKHQLPSYIPSAIFAAAVIEHLVAKSSAGQPIARPSLVTASTTGSTEDFIAVLNTLRVRAGDNLEKLNAEICQWYDHVMDRAGGWFRRQCQKILFAIGLVLALVFNLDSVAIVRHLWTNQAAQAAVVTLGDQVIAGGAPTPATSSGSAGTTPTEAEAQHALQEKFRLLGVRMTEFNRLQEASIPVGWHQPLGDPGLDSTGALVFWKIIGLCATAAAVSAGAPFWFDLLNKVVNMRLTGAVPKKTNDIPSAQ